MIRTSLTYAQRVQLREIGGVRPDARAQRDAALERVRVALEAAQHLVLGTHGMFNINLLDAKQGLETALADVEFERERAQ